MTKCLTFPPQLLRESLLNESAQGTALCYGNSELKVKNAVALLPLRL